MRILIIACVLVAVTGCTKQDTESLGRIGRKLLDRAHSAADDVGNKLDLGWKPGAGEISVRDRVSERLRWEKSLDGLALEVKGEGGNVEITGQVQNAAQHDKALELASSTLGVENVADQLRVTEP
jgi:osmotically-inducible protein OsmY